MDAAEAYAVHTSVIPRDPRPSVVRTSDEVRGPARPGETVSNSRSRFRRSYRIVAGLAPLPMKPWFANLPSTSTEEA